MAVTDQLGLGTMLPADVSQVDETGYVWTFLDRATDPDRVVPGMLIAAGDEEEPFTALVVDIVDGPGGRRIIHLDLVGGPDGSAMKAGGSP